MENNETVLEELAKQFALDYFSISNVISKPGKEDEIKEEVFQKRVRKHINITPQCNIRNIFIIGAGASYDCYKHIPLADNAIKKIRENLRIDNLLSNEAFTKKILEHEEKIMLHKLNPKDFESQLNIYSNFITTEDIRNQLSELYNKKWYPSLFYEILAHLFKHRFIDGIINFNFDELLDQAIEEELSHDDYYRIYSDGQCVPIIESVVTDRLKLPFYIKPHGTISHKSSLKFTKEDYLGLSNEMKQVLTNLISGKRGSNLPIERVNLIVVGSSLKSFEFNEILKKLPSKSAIYFFSTTEPDLDGFQNESPQFTKKFIEHYNIPQTNLNRFYQVKKDSLNELGIIFEKLYSDKLRKTIFNPVYEPKDIYRHKIINEIFYNNDTGQRLFEIKESSNQKNADIKYLLIRTYVEFVIALCKSKGRITLSELMQERFGYYYQLYYDECNSGAPSRKSIYEIFKSFGYEEKFDNTHQRIELEKRDQTGEIIINDLLKKLELMSEDSLYNEFQYFTKDKHKKNNVIGYLKKIYEHDSLSFAPKFSSKKYFTFHEGSEGNILTTKLALIRKFISGTNF